MSERQRRVVGDELQRHRLREGMGDPAAGQGSVSLAASWNAAAEPASVSTVTWPPRARTDMASATACPTCASAAAHITTGTPG